MRYSLLLPFNTIDFQDVLLEGYVNSLDVIVKVQLEYPDFECPDIESGQELKYHANHREFLVSTRNVRTARAVTGTEIPRKILYIVLLVFLYDKLSILFYNLGPCNIDAFEAATIGAPSAIF